MRTGRVVLVSLVAVVLTVGLLYSPLRAQQAPPRINELATTVADGFSIASVGDIIIGYPLSQNTDPAFVGLLKIIRDADVATGNYESHAIDGRTFRGSSLGPFGGTPDSPQDVKAMGFDIVARSNNHIGEFGPEGLFETNDRIEKAGLVYAGSGLTYWAARAPRFVATSKGRVGLVATASSYAQNVMAIPGRGEWPGRGGQSALRVTRNFVLPASMWDAVRTIRQAFPTGGSLYPPQGETDDQITILLQRFKRANIDKPRFSYEMNQQDLKDLLAMVREGKSKSDFVGVSIHAHETEDADVVDAGTTPADFLPVFAKASIDAGADAFFATGPHVARGIEIYKGRPIFYGLGEFVRQMDTIGVAATGCTGEGGGYEAVHRHPVPGRAAGQRAQVRELRGGEQVRPRAGLRDPPVSDRPRLGGAHGASRHSAAGCARDGAADPRQASEAVGAVRDDHHD